nr:CbtA family protein [Actinomycetota bacterium]
TWLSGILRARVTDRNRLPAVVIAGIVAYGLLLVLLPAAPGSAEAAVPAELVWEFRVRSLGGLALLWLGLGLGLGWLLDHDAHRISNLRAVPVAR